MIRAATMRRPATPPTTPPAMAPVFGELSEKDVLVGETDSPLPVGSASVAVGPMLAMDVVSAGFVGDTIEIVETLTMVVDEATTLVATFCAAFPVITIWREMSFIPIKLVSTSVAHFEYPQPH
jgi:hypothetical protein